MAKNSDKVTLQVNGFEYGGWKTVRVSRGIETVSGSFDLSVSDRWSGKFGPWQILEEDECTIMLNGEPVITGYVDRRSISYGPQDHSLTVAGRDKAGDLVDCSAFPDSGKKWEFRNIPLLTLVTRLCAPYGIKVTLKALLGDAEIPNIQKISVDPGESVFDAIERACRIAGVLAVSDGAGGINIVRAGSARTSTALVEGENILGASADFDSSSRFYKYVALGQHSGQDEFSGPSAAHIKGTATDENVRRTARTLVIRPEGGVTTAFAKRRAEWEAKVRAGRGDSVQITVQGWTQGDGKLWPINSLVPVRSPTIGVGGTMLITEAEYSQDESGTITRLTLKRPDAFIPEPTITKASTSKWKELG